MRVFTVLVQLCSNSASLHMTPVDAENALVAAHKARMEVAENLNIHFVETIAVAVIHGSPVMVVDGSGI